MHYEDLTKEELIAYMKLESEEFDFGTGPMKMDKGETLYYKLTLEDFPYNKTNKIKKTIRPKTYKDKFKGRQRAEKLKNIHWSLWDDSKGYIKRVYDSKSRQYAIKLANRKVRNSKYTYQNGGYRKIENIWNIIW